MARQSPAISLSSRTVVVTVASPSVLVVVTMRTSFDGADADPMTFAPRSLASARTRSTAPKNSMQRRSCWERWLDFFASAAVAVARQLRMVWSVTPAYLKAQCIGTTVEMASQMVSCMAGVNLLGRPTDLVVSHLRNQIHNDHPVRCIANHPDT